MKSVRWLALPLLAAIASACGGGPTPAASGDPNAVLVVTSTTVFGNLVALVGGDHVRVTSLVPAGTDVHTYSPKPDGVAAVSRARLVVMNGLGLDDWLQDTVRSANSSAPLVQLAVDLPGAQLLPGEQPRTQNPHLWMDVKDAELYVDRIADALRSADPPNAGAYSSNQAAAHASLETLDAWVREQIATIPEANRRIVTFHDAFPYFAREYGIEIVGVATEAPGQDPSAGEIAALIAAIKAAGVKAIFSENQFPTKLVDQLAVEAGVKVVADLYDDSLGDPPVTSYDAVIRWDVQALVDALR